MWDVLEYFGALRFSKNRKEVKKEEGLKRSIYQGMRCIFVGLTDDLADWLFYVRDSKKTYTSLDASFDENNTSPLSMPDLLYQGT